MDIIIDRNLQKLRAEKGNTQEELASFLLVTPQAVSKWERGESIPDVFLLPKIAAYYNVTVDDLLGVGEIRKREKIAEYEAESSRFDRTGEAEKRAEVWRRAVAEFPNDLQCLTRLMQTLHGSPSGTNDEVIELAERILRESTDSAQRNSATQILALNLMYEERFDEAEKLINTLPSMWVTTDRLLCELYCNSGDKEKGKKEACGNMLQYFDLAGRDLYNLCVFNKGDYEHYIRLHEVFLRLADVIFDDGFYGFYNCRIYARHYWLAKLYTNLHNDERQNTTLKRRRSAQSTMTTCPRNSPTRARSSARASSGLRKTSPTTRPTASARGFCTASTTAVSTTARSTAGERRTGSRQLFQALKRTVNEKSPLTLQRGNFYQPCSDIFFSIEAMRRLIGGWE